jgi:hypothetical protein
MFTIVSLLGNGSDRSDMAVNNISSRLKILFGDKSGEKFWSTLLLEIVSAHLPICSAEVEEGLKSEYKWIAL